MKKIVYTRPDGGLSVVHPAEGARLAYSVTLPDGRTFTAAAPEPVDRLFRRWPVEGATVEWAESEDGFVARIAAKDAPADAVDVSVVDEADVPQDRTFRDQWTVTDGKPGVDVAKARAAWKQRIRDARNRKLAAMDNQTRRLEGLVRLSKASDDDLTAHEQEKQILRDLPNGADGTDALCDAAQTPDELKEIWPDAIS